MQEIKIKQQGIYHDWDQELSQLEILAILETEDGKYHQMMKKIPMSYFQSRIQSTMPLQASTEVAGALK